MENGLGGQVDTQRRCLWGRRAAGDPHFHFLPRLNVTTSMQFFFFFCHLNMDLHFNNVELF